MCADVHPDSYRECGCADGRMCGDVEMWILRIEWKRSKLLKLAVVIYEAVVPVAIVWLSVS